MFLLSSILVADALKLFAFFLAAFCPVILYLPCVGISHVSYIPLTVPVKTANLSSRDSAYERMFVYFLVFGFRIFLGVLGLV